MNIDCPNCGQKPETVTCGPCGEEAPVWARYCPFCGEYMPKPVAEEGEASSMENRRLCPDGNCIGILGEDGRCVICGKS